MNEHDTSDGRPPIADEPSPFGPREVAGGALISRTAPAGSWPRPFSQTSDFIYAERYELEHMNSFKVAQEYSVARQIGLFARLIQSHGKRKALRIMHNKDASTQFDMAKWQAFGS